MTARPLICATVTAPTTAELVRGRDAVCDADLVEIRLDSAADPDVDEALRARRLPVVLTCRSREEGGLYRGSEEERRALLERALDAGADYVDLEWRAGFDEVVRARKGRGIVLSHHDFSGVPADLPARAEAMLATGADIVKIAVMATSLTDCLPLLEIGRRHRDRRVVLIGMGDAGLVTRVFAGRFGSCWTFAGAGVAPGQISVDRLVREFRIRRIGADTRIYGLFARDGGQSPLPAMHNAGFYRLGEDAAYVWLPAANADDAMKFAKGFGVAGATVKSPHDVDLFARVDERDQDAVAAGALTAIACRDGWWVGTNTERGGRQTRPDQPAGGGLDHGGVDLLVEQVCRQQTWWIGRSPDRKAVRAAAEWKLGQGTGHS